jgi:heme/copper-type cytochrome/quinol oxidase subunit 2
MSTSSDLAAVLMIVGLALAIMSYRNYASPPPQYRANAASSLQRVQFLFMTLGIAIFVYGAFVTASAWYRYIYTFTSGAAGGSGGT